MRRAAWTLTPLAEDRGNLMIYIALIAVIGILLLQATGSIPQASVGGPITIALACFTAALAVAIHEAWTRKRGVLGWIVNIVVVFVGVFVAAQAGELVMLPLFLLLSATGLAGPVQGSLAATGGPLLYVSLAGMMLFTLLGAWGALWIVNRWR